MSVSTVSTASPKSITLTKTLVVVSVCLHDSVGWPVQSTNTRVAGRSSLSPTPPGSLNHPLSSDLERRGLYRGARDHPIMMIPNPRCRFWLDGTVCIGASHRRNAPLRLATGCRLDPLLHLRLRLASASALRLPSSSVKRRRPKAFAEPLAAQGFCQGWIGASARDRWLHASLTQELFLGGGESGRQPRPSWDGSFWGPLPNPVVATHARLVQWWSSGT